MVLSTYARRLRTRSSSGSCAVDGIFDAKAIDLD